MVAICLMDVVFSVCIVTRGAVGARVWKYEWFVMQMLYVCVHPVAFLNAAFSMTCSLLILRRGCKRRPYGRGILQNQS